MLLSLYIAAKHRSLFEGTAVCFLLTQDSEFHIKSVDTCNFSSCCRLPKDLAVSLIP